MTSSGSTLPTFDHVGAICGSPRTDLKSVPRVIGVLTLGTDLGTHERVNHLRAEALTGAGQLVDISLKAPDAGEAVYPHPA